MRGACATFWLKKIRVTLSPPNLNLVYPRRNVKKERKKERKKKKKTHLRENDSTANDPILPLQALISRRAERRREGGVEHNFSVISIIETGRQIRAERSGKGILSS